MELDQNKFKTCGASMHLEKPFDSTRLREVVKKLVPKTQTQSLSDHLDFPRMPEFSDERPKMAPPPLTPVQNQPSPAGGLDTWTMDSFEGLSVPLDESPNSDETDDFIKVQLPAQPAKPQPRATEVYQNEPDAKSDWVQKTLANYKLDPSKTVDRPPTIQELELELDYPQSPPAPPTRVAPPIEPAMAPATSHSSTPAPQTALTAQQLEDILRAQSEEIIEKVVWQVVPEIATRIIERELDKLLKERARR